MDIQVEWKEITKTFIDDFKLKKKPFVSMIYTNICQRCKCEPSPFSDPLTFSGHMFKERNYMETIQTIKNEEILNFRFDYYTWVIYKIG